MRISPSVLCLEILIRKNPFRKNPCQDLKVTEKFKLTKVVRDEPQTINP